MKKILSTYALLFIVCTLFSQNNSLPNWIPTDGLYGYWPLDGNIYDLSGNENHGTTDGQYSTETYENGNQSVYLQNQMIILPTNSDLNIDNFTVTYGYDMALSELNQYANGNHYFGLSYKFGQDKKCNCEDDIIFNDRIYISK